MAGAPLQLGAGIMSGSWRFCQLGCHLGRGLQHLSVAQAFPKDGNHRGAELVPWRVRPSTGRNPENKAVVVPTLSDLLSVTGKSEAYPDAKRGDVDPIPQCEGWQ